MLSTETILQTLDDITFRDWNINLRYDVGRPYLQVSFMEEDIETGEISQQRGRKWFLSFHMTKSEIVSTALKAVLTAVEHEAREQFRYKGRMIFGPHFDVDALVEFSRLKENLDMRTGAWVKM